MVKTATTLGANSSKKATLDWIVSIFGLFQIYKSEKKQVLYGALKGAAMRRKNEIMRKTQFQCFTF